MRTAKPFADFLESTYLITSFETGVVQKNGGMKVKKMLILGSDFCTLHVVKEAQKLGLYVIVTDLMIDSPTKSIANEAWNISTTDIDLLEQKCRENDIAAVGFGASDFNISNARELCRRLNLPIYCENEFSWRVARNKSEFKKLCQECCAPVAQDYEITDDLTNEQLNAVKFPVVVKPCDKSGNRGMSYCSNKDELVRAYQYARSITEDKIIVERQLHGPEYNVHYALADGSASLLYFSATHHQKGERENLYSFKMTTSCHLKQYIDEVNDKAIEVLKKVGCKEGIAWFDIMRDEDGKFYMLEMGYRFGGVMTYVPYEKVSGFNTTKWMIECALGIQHKQTDLPKPLNEALSGCAGSYHLFTRKDGKVNDIRGLEIIEKLPNVWIDMPKRAGSEVRYNACMGLIGIYGENITQMCGTLMKINRALKVENESEENMIIYFDDYELLEKMYFEGLEQFNKR